MSCCQIYLPHLVTIICDDQTQFKVHKFVLDACSTVFRNILKSTPGSPYIYLRGIAKEEMESLLQFMYHGAATLSQNRMQEFLNAAKDLDIKEIGTNYNPDLDLTDEVKGKSQDDVSIDDCVDGDNAQLKDETHVVKNISDPQDDYYFQRSIAKVESENAQVNEDGKYICDRCQQAFLKRFTLRLHIGAVHEDVKFPCQHCDYKASNIGSLHKYTKSKHEGVRFPCNKCDYKGTQAGSLNRHIRQKHPELI